MYNFHILLVGARKPGASVEVRRAQKTPKGRFWRRPRLPPEREGGAGDVTGNRGHEFACAQRR